MNYLFPLEPKPTVDRFHRFGTGKLLTKWTQTAKITIFMENYTIQNYYTVCDVHFLAQWSKTQT